MIDEEIGDLIEFCFFLLGIEDEIGMVCILYFLNDGNKVFEWDFFIKKLNLNGEEVCVMIVFDLILVNYGVNWGFGE